MLLQAIRMTIPDFQLDKIEDFLFTLDEMKLVNQIGNAYSLSGDNEKAADIFYRLLQYIRRHLPETVTSNRMLPLVLYNFARSLDLSQKYEEGAKVARYGKEACIKYGHYQVLHSCLEIEAECDFFLGKREESVERYREAFYICKVMGYEDDLQIIRTEAEEYLNILFVPFQRLVGHDSKHELGWPHKEPYKEGLLLQISRRTQLVLFLSCCFRISAPIVNKTAVMMTGAVSFRIFLISRPAFSEIPIHNHPTGQEHGNTC